MSKFGMVININRCTACYCCVIACKDEYWDNDYLPYSISQPRFGQFWMNMRKKERGIYPYVKAAYMPVPCMHCQNAPCIEAADNNAVYRRSDGIILIDPEKAKGQRQLVDSCPYNAIFWNTEKNLPQKCSLCVHRLESGKQPRCVQVCPSDAIMFGNLEDQTNMAAKLWQDPETKSLYEEFGTSPQVKYIHLEKITSLFLAGAAVLGDSDECAENAKVTLINDSGQLNIHTDCYGNFDFDGLSPGEYKLTIEAVGYHTKSMDVSVHMSTYIPEIIMQKSG